MLHRAWNYATPSTVCHSSFANYWYLFILVFVRTRKFQQLIFSCVRWVPSIISSVPLLRVYRCCDIRRRRIFNGGRLCEMYSVRGRRSLGEKETWYISFVVLRRTGDVERVGTRDLFLFSGKDFVLPQCGGKTKFQYRTRLRRELTSFFFSCGEMPISYLASGISLLFAHSSSRGSLLCALRIC